MILRHVTSITLTAFDNDQSLAELYHLLISLCHSFPQPACCTAVADKEMWPLMELLGYRMRHNRHNPSNFESMSLMQTVALTTDPEEKSLMAQDQQHQDAQLAHKAELKEKLKRLPPRKLKARILNRVSDPKRLKSKPSLIGRYMQQEGECPLL